MKINAQQSSIDCFHGRVQSDRARQQKLILSAMETGRDYTGQELSLATGLTPNIISARLFELREELKLLNRPKDRKHCPITNVLVYVHRKGAAMKQVELELEAA